MKCAIMGSGNIGTDLLEKLRRSSLLELVAMIGIDPESDGLARSRDYGIETSYDGIEWFRENSGDIDLVFEATSPRVHKAHAEVYESLQIQAIDLTPAKIGPQVVPSVNLGQHLLAPNVNLITCGGQASVPIVYAAARVGDVAYSEIISTVASLSAGPGTRQNIDEFTKTTAGALVDVGGARAGKAIIILNPAEPPILMRNTVYTAVSDDTDPDAVVASIKQIVNEVQQGVPGYRLVSDPTVETDEYSTPSGAVRARVVTLLQVEGAADYFPPYAGNLDIMTASALQVGEAIAQQSSEASK